MQKIPFEKLYSADFEISDLFCMRQKWVEGVLFRMDHPRKSNGILYLKGCSGTYTFSGRSFEAPRKSIVYIPQGGIYTCLNRDCGHSVPDAYLVEFNLRLGGESAVLSDVPLLFDDFDPYIAELIKKAVSAYESPLRSPAAVRAAIYSLLSELGQDAKKDFGKKYQSIAPGIRLLEESPFASYSVEELSAACSLSSGCFRRLFREYSGKSPVEYRNNLKIEMAKSLLENSNATLEVVAESLGFESSAYFCRVFKKKTGMAPGEWRSVNK